MKTKVRLMLVLFIVTTLLVWVWKPDRKLRIVFCDVGEGDATLVILGSFQALIDTGGSGEKILSCLGEHIPFWDRKIELLLVSHDQKDHSGALSVITRRYAVIRLIGNQTMVGDRLRYGKLDIDILWPDNIPADRGNLPEEALNSQSVVTRLSYGTFSVLLTGDIGEKEESAMIDSGLLNKITVLKVPHHGSKFSSSLPFLNKISPNEAVVSVGANNSYGHPTTDAMSRIDLVGAKIWRTDKQGMIEIISDGEKYWVKTEK